MKKSISKLVTLAVAGILGLGAAIPAVSQESLTSASTYGVFSTDVDDFMDVNGWSGVQPEKAFVFADFYASSLSAGFAKQFKNFYLGTYFSGAFAGIYSYKDDDVEITSFGTSASEVNTTDATIAAAIADMGNVQENDFEASVLFGFGDMALKFGLFYLPKTFYYKGPSDLGKEIEYRQDNYSIIPAVEWGLNSAVNEKEFDIHAGVALTLNPWVTEYDGNESKQSAPNYLDLNVGFSYDFDDEGPITQQFKLDVSDTVSIYVDDKSDTGENQDNIFVLTPAYSLKYEPEDSRFAAGLDLGLPLALTTASDSDTDFTGVNFTAEPEIAAAIEYQIVKNKLRFNSGIALGLGAFDLNVDDYDGDKATTFKVFDEYSMGMAAGLTWLVTEHVTIDTTMNVFYRYDTTDRYGASLSNIWNNKFGIQAAVKF